MPRKSKAARRAKPAVMEPVPVTAPAAEPMPPIAEPIAIVVPVPPIAMPARLPDRFQAVLASSQRGNIQTRRVPTWHGAFEQARRLLSEAESREWHRGEVVSVRIEPVQD
jgi:hypothetical protein